MDPAIIAGVVVGALLLLFLLFLLIQRRRRSGSLKVTSARSERPTAETPEGGGET